MKEREMHCAICNKVTVHVQAFEALRVFHAETSPWMCIHDHPGDGTRCHCCGGALGERSVKMGKMLGVTKIACGLCNKPAKPSICS